MQVPAFLRAFLSLLVLAFIAPAALAQNASPHAIHIPKWFVPSFLDFREDVADARQANKRVMVYIGQDGCPYCAKLMNVNFKQPDIERYTRERFLPIELNMWGDRETVWLDGIARPEKELAKALNVQFTPTLLFLDEQGKIIARINGYYEPKRFMAALRYAGEHMEEKLSFAEHLQRAVTEQKTSTSAQLIDQPFFLKPPYDLHRKPDGKPLAVLVESQQCADCRELHERGFSDATVQRLIKGFDVVRLTLDEQTALVTPDGKPTTAADWLATQRVVYTPSILYFDSTGASVLRLEAYVGPFHLASAFDYIGSGAYRKEPSFQRYLQKRADEVRARGEMVTLD